MADNPNPCGEVVCKEFPELKRLNYCYGQMLGAQDFVDEQEYFLNKIALLTRCLHGYGVVCGLYVESLPKPTLDYEQVERPVDSYDILVDCGLAVDARGRELVLNEQFKCNLPTLLSRLPEHDQEKFRNDRMTECSLYLTINYHAHPCREQSPPNGGCCGNGQKPYQTRWSEEPWISLTFDVPPQQTCNSCCDPIGKDRIWLAKLTFKKGQLVDIDNTIRRPIATYETTKIRGTNWLHSGIYREDLAEWLVSGGLEIHFSAPIQVNSINAHNVKLNVSHKDPTSNPKKTAAKKSWESFVTNDIVEIAISDELPIHSSNSLQILQCEISLLGEGTLDTTAGSVPTATGIKVFADLANLGAPKRVLVTVRSEFIRDVCGRPIDGSNFGGTTSYIGNHPDIQNVDQEYVGDKKETDEDFAKRVARLKSFYDLTRDEHNNRFLTSAPSISWDSTRRSESGNGVVGSNFQSWFYSVENDSELPK